LGRSGEITAVRRAIGSLPPAERPGAGKLINEAVETLEAELAAARERLARAALEASLADTIDVTFPGPPAHAGAIHPVRAVAIEIARYFMRHGFAVVGGPEIETDANNFDALNIPPDHPAREGLASCCARTPRRCRCARCARIRRRSRSSFPGRSTAATRSMRVTSTCSIRSKG
jgi:phenylalanyl-tRNA synthetase alpha subunit